MANGPTTIARKGLAAHRRALPPIHYAMLEKIFSRTWKTDTRSAKKRGARYLEKGAFPTTTTADFSSSSDNATLAIAGGAAAREGEEASYIFSYLSLSERESESARARSHTSSFP